MQQPNVAQAAPDRASRRKVVLIVAGVAAALLLYFSSLTILSSLQLLDFGPSAGTISYAPDSLAAAASISLDRPITAAAWSPDGTLVATADGGAAVELRRISDGQRIGTLDAGSAPTALFFSPDGRTVVAATAADEIRAWSTADSKALYAPLKLPAPLKVVMVSADGQRIHAAGSDGTLFIWQLVDGQKLLERAGKLPPLRDGAAWSEDGRVLAYADSERGIVLWSLEKDEEQRVIEPPGARARVVALAFSHLGGLLAAQDERGQVEIFRTQTGEHVQTFAWAGQGATDSPPVSASAFSADARLFALGGADGRIELWDVQRGQLRATVSGQGGAVRAIGFADDGATMGAAGAAGAVQTWRAKGP